VEEILVIHAEVDQEIADALRETLVSRGLGVWKHAFHLSRFPALAVPSSRLTKVIIVVWTEN
jgi:hypothetical protein